MTQNEHVYASCCRPEVAGDVISGENVNTIERYALLNFEAASFSSFRENQNQPLALCVDDDRPTWVPFSGSRSTMKEVAQEKIEAIESQFPKM